MVGAVSSYLRPRGAVFDGTNDYLEGTSLSTADATRLVLSFWFKRSGSSDGVLQTVLSCTSFRVYCWFATSDTMFVRARNSSATNLWLATIQDFTADTDWHHIFIYMDASGANAGFAVVDNATGSPISPSTETSGTIDSSRPNYSVAAHINGTALFDGELAHVWLGDPGRAVTTADVVKFNDGGAPRFPGRNPFGGPEPFVALFGGADNMDKSWAANGSMPITGALTESAGPIAHS